MNQDTLDLLYATAEKDPHWRTYADFAIDDLASSGEPFTAEDVTRIAGMPAEPNRVGAVLNAAAQAGRIRRVGYAESTRKSRHSGLVRVWQGVR